MFEIKLATGNDAFGDDDESKGREISRILAHITKRIAQGVYSGVIADINGNRCGEWGLRDE